MQTKTRTLNQITYIGVIELCFKCASLDQASYFLSQMDRLKLSIPRALLDMFLECSLTLKAFERSREELLFDTDDPYKNNMESVVNQRSIMKLEEFNIRPESNPELSYYYNSKGNYKSRIAELKKEYTKLKLDCKPFIPKGSNITQTTCDQERSERGENTLIYHQMREYEPKNYKLIKK